MGSLDYIKAGKYKMYNGVAKSNQILFLDKISGGLGSSGNLKIAHAP